VPYSTSSALSTRDVSDKEMGAVEDLGRRAVSESTYQSAAAHATRKMKLRGDKHHISVDMLSLSGW
jgi:hypothetical protein